MGYKLELKYEQDFYCDDSQIVYINEMGSSDMEMMSVSRLDWWAIQESNLEEARREVTRKEEVKTYGEVKRKRNLDPRKRKVGNAGVSTSAKKPTLDAGVGGGDEEDEEYAYREQEELVDEREEQEELWRLQQEEERGEEEEYDYEDGEGLL